MMQSACLAAERCEFVVVFELLAAALDDLVVRAVNATLEGIVAGDRGGQLVATAKHLVR